MVRLREGRHLTVVVASVLLLALVAPALAVGGAAADDSGDSADARAPTAPAPIVALQGFQADRTAFRIAVYENGSAEWRFRYEKSLNESERDDFEAFAAEFNTNDTELYRNFRNRAGWLTDNGSTATGREMRAENFQRSARVEGIDPQTQPLGVVEMSFRWEGFARVTDEGRVVAGDIFEGGLYIGPDQEVLYVTGPTLDFVSADPADDDRVLSGDSLADSESVTWTGEKSFTDQRPRAEFTPADRTPADTATGTDGTSSGSDPGLLLPVGALLVVLLVGAGAAVAYRTGALPPGDDGGSAAGATSDDGSSGAAGAAGAAAGADSAVGVSEAELLSDEERVMNLLEDNGGRMKQVDIVEETDWSKSKVSMLLSDMEDEDKISKLRVGRENIVSLTGEEPDAAGSPFDNEE